ncbi:WSC-domain-containing protein [Glonium stellatum]|uniref:WSC-domain-containing protein n=1 Tax=Glonium stellatum TaxID=574774 RepID=A0A8E2JUY0_9PEZI|nr:WSC-domain-containing protein [Glonium stellatum]
MRIAAALAAIWVFGSILAVHSHDSTDTLMDGDSAQSGYLPNHNMDPTVISGGSFGQMWQYKAAIPSGSPQDQFYAKLLVYTPSTLGRQIVLAFSEANRIYILDAVNGTLIAKRDLSLEGESPFQVADLPSCNDIGQNIGITGTPVIDPSTDTIYFWAKSYLSSGQRGWQNGAYRFHAIDAATLAERAGFPINIQGAMAGNDNTRWFTGGTHLQRASLNLVNGIVFAGFGGHCDLFNYTGWVVGMSTSGKYLTGYVSSGGLGAPPEDGTWTGGGGGGGVWMSGAAIASDNSGRIFYATGNGKGTTVNQQLAASGRVHLNTLSECMVNLAINPQTGALTQHDYFEPSAYLGMDAGDRDLGSGAVCLPDPATFSGGGIVRIAINCGKNGNCYITNADNLGGYKMGAGGGDAIIQTLTPPSGGSIFGNSGTYPLEGGYLYISPVGSPTYVYSLGFDTNGRPAFTLVAQTDDNSPGAVGVGPATITTLNGQPGTAILWVVDTDGVRAYNAVPVNGKMIKINLPATPGPSKFQRPAFGNGRYYMSGTNGVIAAFGAPVALPLNCTSLLDFGSVTIGATRTMMLNCTANVAIVRIQGMTIGKSIYQAQNSSLPQGSLNAGDSFSASVSFNLTGYVLSSGSTSAPSVSPGVQSTALNLYTTNGVAGYSTQQGITLTGNIVSANPFMTMSPLQVNFPSLIVGSSVSTSGSASTFIIHNLGQSALTISGYAYSNDTSGPFANVTMDSSANGTYVLDINGYFTSQDLPLVSTTIPAGGSITVNVKFLSSVVGTHFTILTAYSDGGSAYSILTGAANTAPIALLEASTNEGGWLQIPDCATPADGCTLQVDIGTAIGPSSMLKTIRFTNNGGSNLIITKSKPPTGSFLGATNPTTDLSEGLAILPSGQSTATVYFQPGSAYLNADPVVYSGAWTLNTNDLSFGVHVLNFTGTLAPPRVGPLLSNGLARFKYLGCFQDGAAARIESTQIINVNNTNGLCQQQGLTAGFPFAGTEYQTECWVGYTIPSASAKVADSKCATYTCPGDQSQLCGGVGGYMSMYYDTIKYDPSIGAFIGGYAPPSAPPQVGSYRHVGCFADNAGARTLSGGNVGNAKTNSLESCAAACKGTLYFGTEYAAECYCGNSLLNNPTQQPDSQCGMICPGNSSEICGAGSRLTLYINNGTSSSIIISSSTSKASSSSSSISSPGVTSATSSTISSIFTTTSVVQSVGTYNLFGCFTDSLTARALSSSKFTSSTSMTVETCVSGCQAKGYTKAGVEYGGECYCGNNLAITSTVASTLDCMASFCTGNLQEYCGGSKRLLVYSSGP